MGNTPNIRFKGFTDDWEQRKLGEISSSFEYGLNAAAKEYDGENKYIRITDIDDDSREFKQEDITSPDIDLSSAENYRLSEGDILFARTGASVGKSYIYKVSDGLVYYAGFLIRARIKSEYNAEFVFQNTFSGDYEKFIKVTSMRSGQPGVNAQEYSKYQIMVPSKPEQDKISDSFRSLDNLITLHQRKCDETKKLKKFMLQKMFPKKDANKPEIRFAGFTDDWEQRKWIDTVDISTEMVDPTTGEYDDMPHIAPGNIEPFTGRILDNVKTVKEEQLISGKFRFRPNDVVYGKINPQLGKYFYASIDGLTSADAYVFNGKNGITQKFLYSVLQTKDFFKYSISVSKRSGMPKINRDELNAYSFCVPKEEEQEKIGDFLLGIDNLITLHQRKCDELKEFKKYMLQNMFPQKG